MGALIPLAWPSLAPASTAEEQPVSVAELAGDDRRAGGFDAYVKPCWPRVRATRF